jgi:hypothetical protein
MYLRSASHLGLANREGVSQPSLKPERDGVLDEDAVPACGLF